MKILKERFDKKDVQELPRVLFEGRIETVLTPSCAERAVDYLLQQRVLGIDTETRPSFKRGCVNKVSLLQVATHDICFLFRLNRIGVTDAVKMLLEDCSVEKVGLSLHDDLNMLSKRREFTPGTFIDIQHEAKEVGIADMSLQKIYANVFGQKISKNQQLSNWDADILTDAQKLYAATDAWACIMIHEELQRLCESGDYELVRQDADNDLSQKI